MGDLEYPGWLALKTKYPEVKCDALKFPHHGGAWEELQTDDLLSTVKPSLVVLSVGSDNTYGHPGPEVFTSLQKRSDIRLLCTQATDSCMAKGSVQNEVTTISAKFRDQASKDSSFFVFSGRNRCPCAGTVIIELGDRLRVLQPNLDFHSNNIVSIHFKGHKCLIPA
jgi:competence protein ComEC